MKRSIISLCVLALITVGVMCNARKEKKSKHESDVHHSKRRLESTRMKLQLMEI